MTLEFLCTCIQKKSVDIFLPSSGRSFPGGHSNFFPAEEYEFHENAPRELKEVVVQYFERGSKWVPNENQVKFKKIRNEGGRMLLSKEMILNDVWADMMTRYRLASRLESAAGVLAADLFVENMDGECI